MENRGWVPHTPSMKVWVWEGDMSKSYLCSSPRHQSLEVWAAKKGAYDGVYFPNLKQELWRNHDPEMHVWVTVPFHRCFWAICSLFENKTLHLALSTSLWSLCVFHMWVSMCTMCLRLDIFSKRCLLVCTHAVEFLMLRTKGRRTDAAPIPSYYCMAWLRIQAACSSKEGLCQDFLHSRIVSPMYSQ